MKPYTKSINFKQAITNEGLFLAIIIAMIITASILTPNPKFYGTHQQLFFPPCIFHKITGLPCAFCGMTTSFAFIMHGDFKKAFLSHPFGPILFLTLCVSGIYLLFVIITKRRIELNLTAFDNKKINNIIVYLILIFWVSNLIVHFIFR